VGAAVPIALWFDKSTASLRFGKNNFFFFCVSAANPKQSATKKEGQNCFRPSLALR
jgi:hypothetical protein